MKLLKQIVEQSIELAIADLGVSDNWKSALGPSREKEQADITLPCFVIAKELKRNPVEIAQELAAKISGKFEVSSVGGYLNFKADPEWLVDLVLSHENKQNGQKILIEHTSANPNGPFHVGRARNAILGDTLVRLHRLYGNDVRAEYYVDDMGKQVAVLA